MRVPTQTLLCPGCGAEITLAGAEDETVRVERLRDGRCSVVAERFPAQIPDAGQPDRATRLSMSIESEGRSLHTCLSSSGTKVDDRYDLLVHHDAQMKSALERMGAGDVRRREQFARMLRSVSDQIAKFEAE